MADKYQQAVAILREKYEELGRLPTKNDFEDGDGKVGFIKGVLGPWPRALEKAGLKTPAPKKRRARPHPRKSRQGHREGLSDRP